MLEENINIEKELFPESWAIQEDKDGNLTAEIVDMELDPYPCSFTFSETVEIETKGYTHITLSIDDLYRLIDLIEESEERYKEQSKTWED